MKKVMVVLAIVFLSSMAVQAQEGSGGGYGMGQGMMGGGGYGMGQGMMGGGGYGMGQGMMGGGGYGMMGPGNYAHSPECQAFYTETAKLRRDLHDKKFEYFETLRNPKTTGETVTKFDKEIKDLQEKIYAKAPIGCGW